MSLPEDGNSMITTRRAFLQGATVAMAAASTARLQAQTTTARTARTSVLEIGYFEAGDPSGFPVLLLHGFPDDAHAYDQVAPVLARAGYRAISVFLRGFGPTRFLDRSAPRTAEQAAIGQDVIDLADALSLPALQLQVMTGVDAPPPLHQCFDRTGSGQRC